MNIGLLNLEPNYRNLALEKLRIYYSQQGDAVEDYFALNKYDKVFASSIFTFTPKDVVPEGAICGGSGFELVTKLPPEIHDIKPHSNHGFMTRGCPNKCPFCIVHMKEGDIIIECTLLDLWDGISKDVTAYDNNALALPDYFAEQAETAIKYHIRIDYNQGLDHRKLTTDIVLTMKRMPHKEYRFAFDSPAYYQSVDRAIKLLQENGINRCLWYVLVGFNTTFQEDLDRVNFLRERGQQAYIQRFRRPKNDWRHIALAQWVNQHHIFYGMTFEQFLDTEHSKKRKYDKLVGVTGSPPGQ